MDRPAYRYQATSYSGKNENVFAYEIGARAAQAALSKAGLTKKDVDGIICATFTPDYFFPSTACKIQGVLGCTNSLPLTYQQRARVLSTP